MKDNRIFTGSISIRVGGTRSKLDLSPAEIHGGPKGLYRVRLARCWLQSPEGEALFFDATRLAELIVSRALGTGMAVLPDSPPDIPRGSRVSVWFQHEDRRHCEGVWTASPPFRAFDGQFYVWVMTITAGFIAVPVDDVTLVRRRYR